MKTYNIVYEDEGSLLTLVEKEKIKDSSNIMIQVFTSISNKRDIKNFIEEINKILPSSHLLGSTTDGEIINGEVTKGKTILSLTIFEDTQLETIYVENKKQSSLEVGVELSKKLSLDVPNLLFLFTDGLNTNGEEFLNGVNLNLPNVKVAGGMAGDGGRFEKTFVFTKDAVIDSGAVGISLKNENLIINNQYNFNWLKIGKEMTITESKENVVYKIDGKTAVETYAHYLGEEIANLLPNIGIEFPLILTRDGIDMARAVVGVNDDESLIFAGNLNVGDRVQFGYGDLASIMEHATDLQRDISNNSCESIFVYSCMARKRFLKDSIKEEIAPFGELASTIGFFTYGEFYFEKKKHLFNQVMTSISISENAISPISSNIINNSLKKEDKQNTNTLKALTNLIQRSSEELKFQYEEMKEQKNFLKYQANHDFLTGLYNRSFFYTSLDLQIEKAKRREEGFALLFIDLDGFKEINDNHGHHIGDYILKEVSSRLKSRIRTSDIVSRLGGDEFTIILDNIDTIEDISSIANNILFALNEKIDGKYKLSGSIGISRYPGNAVNSDELIKYSDKAMYGAKDNGKNTIKFCTEKVGD